MAITDKNKSTIERLKELKSLYEAGILTKEEMDAEKAEILRIKTTANTENCDLNNNHEKNKAIKEDKEEHNQNNKPKVIQIVKPEKSFFEVNKRKIFTIIGILVIVIGSLIAAVINRDNRNEKMSAAPSIDTLTTDTLVIDSALVNIPDEPDRFEFKDIKRRKGNFKVIVEWPVSMTGIGDISKLHNCLTNKVFNRDCNDIYDCIEQYLKEGEESAAEAEYDVNGFVSLKFVQRQNDIYIFNKLTFADYGGAGAAVIYDDSYINFDKELGRDLTIDDLTDNNDALLSVINSHISLDEYSSKADKLPKKFIINPDGITFIFPQYSIGIGAQGQPHISLSYDEMNGILSETFKRAIGNVPFEEKWERCNLSGTMTDKSGSYPIKMTFGRRGHDLRNCIYRNVNYGGEIKMKGFLTQGHWCFIGKDGENDFSIEVDIYNMTGTARVGEKVFSVSFK